MRKSAIAQHVVYRTGRSRLVIPRTKHHPVNMCRRYSAGAHHTRLQGDNEGMPGKHPVTGAGTGLLDGQDFGVGGGIAPELFLISRARNDIAVGSNNESGDRHIRAVRAINPHHLGEGDGLAHQLGFPLGTHRLELMRVHVADHPLVTHKLTVLRDVKTPSPTFRQLVSEIMTLLAYESTRGVRLTPVDIVTPVAPTQGVKIAEPKPLVVPILRAGLGMLEGMVTLLPSAEVGFLGMARNETTLTPTTYAERLPERLEGRQCFVLDPMLATGGSLIAAIDFLFDRGATEVVAVCILASPEGLAALEAAMGDRDVTVVVAAVDERLNEHGYIVPGLGDAGDRLYGTV